MVPKGLLAVNFVLKPGNIWSD